MPTALAICIVVGVVVAVMAARSLMRALDLPMRRRV